MTSATVKSPRVSPICRMVRWLGCGLALAALAWVGCAVARPGAEVARRKQAALAAQRLANARTIPGLNLDLAWMSAGSFTMGVSDPNADFFAASERSPETFVTITQPYWLGRTEVTQAQWLAVMGSTEVMQAMTYPALDGWISSLPDHAGGEGAHELAVATENGDLDRIAKLRDLPVLFVSWEDAMEFCRRLTERERAAGRLPTGYVYTLPTEAQWEYAARVSTAGGHADDHTAIIWRYENSNRPQGTRQPSEWGLFDLHGNGIDWCSDWHFQYPGGAVTDPIGPATAPASGSLRVARFSGLVTLAEGRSENLVRAGFVPGLHSQIIGFRVALSLPPPKRSSSLPSAQPLGPARAPAPTKE